MRNLFGVYDEYTAQLMYTGTYDECVEYIKKHDGEYYIEER